MDESTFEMSYFLQTFEHNLFLPQMREYQLRMMMRLLGMDELEEIGPRDWSPRTGKCLCKKLVKEGGVDGVPAS